MKSFTIITQSYFDGEELFQQGPYRITLENGLIKSILASEPNVQISDSEKICVPFLMPGLVEAHCHIFLDGDELDQNIRAEYLQNANHEKMLQIAKRNVFKNLSNGITLIRDAGDKHGINAEIKSWLSSSSDLVPEFRSPGKALRKAKRYGSFMAREISSIEEIPGIINEMSKSADDLKILLTGIIDFENGIVKGEPQFTLEEARLIAKCAKENNKMTFAHCSGIEGLKILVESGIDSVEHGFFMTPKLLKKMVEKGIAWVPTYSPVQFQWKHPEHCNWNEKAVTGLRDILDNHDKNIRLAAELNCHLIAGSDAGSYGVPHGKGLIDEMIFMSHAGVSLKKILTAATTTSRQLWGEESSKIIAGNKVNMISLEGSPFENIDYLYETKNIWLGKNSLKVSSQNNLIRSAI